MTGRLFSATEALHIGFVSGVVPGGRVQVISMSKDNFSSDNSDAAVQLASIIAAKSPVAVVSTKHLMNRAFRISSQADMLQMRETTRKRALSSILTTKRRRWACVHSRLEHVRLGPFVGSLVDYSGLCCKRMMSYKPCSRQLVVTKDLTRLSLWQGHPGSLSYETRKSRRPSMAWEEHQWLMTRRSLCSHMRKRPAGGSALQKHVRVNRGLRLDSVFSD